MSNCGEPEVFVIVTNKRVMEKSCGNCRTSPPQWECSEIRVKKQKQMANDCEQWQPEYDDLQQSLADTQQINENLKAAPEIKDRALLNIRIMSNEEDIVRIASAAISRANEKEAAR